MTQESPVRRREWLTTFYREVTAELNKPFDWATSNCGHLVGVAIRACHGEDHPCLKHLNAGWDSEDEVFDYLEVVGDMDGILSKDFERLDTWMFAQEADVGYYLMNGTQMGAVICNGVALIKGLEGRIHRLHPKTLTAIFHV